MQAERNSYFANVGSDVNVSAGARGRIEFDTLRSGGFSANAQSPKTKTLPLCESMTYTRCCESMYSASILRT